jgi:hypothetical protein
LLYNIKFASCSSSSQRSKHRVESSAGKVTLRLVFNYNQSTELLLFPSLYVPAPHKEASTESKTDDRRCKRSGVLARVKLGKGARAKKQAKRRKQKAVGVIRCFSLSKNWYLNISAKVGAPLGNHAHRNKSSMNITVQWLATHPCKKKAWVIRDRNPGLLGRVLNVLPNALHARIWRLKLKN